MQGNNLAENNTEFMLQQCATLQNLADKELLVREARRGGRRQGRVALVNAEQEARRERIRELEEKIEAMKQEHLLKQTVAGQEVTKKFTFPINPLLLVGVIVLGIAQFIPVDFFEKNSSQNTNQVKQEMTLLESAGSEVEKDILLSLDQRRADLANRAMYLDTREQEIMAKEKALEGKTKELKTLWTELQAFRNAKDQSKITRLEQLAEVYASMAPEQASPIIAKLDDETALSLLQRMNGKRMGQILSLMASERAIELTKGLKNNL